MVSSISSPIFFREPIAMRRHRDQIRQGCDASILLDDVGSFLGEKPAFPNVNPVRGYDVINNIKMAVEASCSGVVSPAPTSSPSPRATAPIWYAAPGELSSSLSLVCPHHLNFYSPLLHCMQLGDPSWDVPLGRRDSTTVSWTLANSDLQSPASNLSTLVMAFGNKGLSARDMTALSGAHTIGYAQCKNFHSHIYNDTESTLRSPRCGTATAASRRGPLTATWRRSARSTSSRS
ncbi:Peroxidase 70 [Dichanthelium oligosanthes]|uniref:Peroxidase 70 n=1 Tax=Dichanthelium oligosanthes TaxID=888268 RepID=A0A1E5W8B3_9POAL|nr:Peroxidase 70 [Dichanthelium oligosanthes]